MDKNGEGHCYTCMGCRSFLTPYVDPETGKPKYYGRFNQGVVTINLHALIALFQSLLDDEGQVLALLLVLGLAEIHEDRDKGGLSVGGQEGQHTWPPLWT